MSLSSSRKPSDRSPPRKRPVQYQSRTWSTPRKRLRKETKGSARMTTVTPGSLSDQSIPACTAEQICQTTVKLANARITSCKMSLTCTNPIQGHDRCPDAHRSTDHFTTAWYTIRRRLALSCRRHIRATRDRTTIGMQRPTLLEYK